MESLIRIPVISHLEIDVACKYTVDAADAVEVAEFDVLGMKNDYPMDTLALFVGPYPSMD
ncbi:hypothetical protein PENSUB_11060 [Penicillium subrubescens]|uniref:Uncharacterized protein n=1 Tax=Penicillium subrubescens TaxID=1316194 RepID=A0A1Q5T5S4_9EURO|nr:hypothetical protein PENSUB_11060 [Penicillium subrubescens]